MVESDAEALVKKERHLEVTLAAFPHPFFIRR
jgi:hypothetical protein